MPLSKNGSQVTVNGTVWAAEWRDLSSVRAPAASTPTITTMVGGWQTYAFSASAMNQLMFSVIIPQGLQPGSSLVPVLRWAPQSTNAAVCRWGLEYSLQIWGGPAPTATTTVYVEQAAGGLVNKPQVVEFPVITGAAPAAILACRLFRDAAHANDAFTGTAFGLAFGVWTQQDRDGTSVRVPPWDL